MNNQRRIFLKSSAAVGAFGLAASTGLLIPTSVIAARPDGAFKTDSAEASMKSLFGTADAEKSADIAIKAPKIAENGAVVPITISTKMANVESITVLAPNNPQPLVAHMEYSNGLPGFISVRMKMGKTGDVIGVVKADGKLYTASKNVKVTIGGCGG